MKTTDLEVPLHFGIVNFLESLDIEISQKARNYGYFIFEINVTATDSIEENGAFIAEDYETEFYPLGCEHLITEEVSNQIELLLSTEIPNLNDILGAVASEDVETLRDNKINYYGN